MSVENWDNLAFEGAQGFGASATGGRGGKVVKVTNLKDSGAGSLRWALEDLDEPRIVVFTVGGQIDLEEEIQINGDVTVAGQTAPGGITVTGERLRVVDSNVIIRGMNLRPGDEKTVNDADDRDGISVGRRGSVVEDVIIDSNSITWAVDENTSTWSSPSNVTWSNNIIAEALMDSIHPKGEHSMGMLIGDESSNVSIIGNLFASNDQRNAIIKDGSENIEFINNVVYNYGRQGLVVKGGSVQAIGNVMIAGEASNGRAAMRFDYGEGRNAFYVEDNLSTVGGDATSKIRSSQVFESGTDDILPSEDVLDWVLTNAGVIIDGERSKIGQRIVDTVLDDAGKLVDSPSDVGGYLDKLRTAALLDSDGDGIPNVYEAVIGSNANKSDAQGDADGNGLANIEDYINGLIDGFGTASGGTTTVTQAIASPTTSPTSSEAETGDTVTVLGTTSSSGVQTTAGSFTVEAEDFDLKEGFSVHRLAGSSGGQILKSLRDAEASTTFTGAAGSYDLDLTYYDETDGVSYLEIHLNDTMLDAWYWDADEGSRLADKHSLSHRVIEGVDLEAGDELIFIGSGARAPEPLRIDALTFTPSDTVL